MSTRTRVVLLSAAVVIVAVPLRAQQASRTVDRGASNGTLSFAHDPNIIPQQVTFGQLIAAVNSQTGHLARLKGMTDLQSSSVRLVNVQGLMVGNNQQALQTALDRNQHAVADMRSGIGDNQVITGLLRARELTPANVVAVDVAANGTVWVFYRE